MQQKSSENSSINLTRSLCFFALIILLKLSKIQISALVNVVIIGYCHYFLLDGNIATMSAR